MLSSPVYYLVEQKTGLDLSTPRMSPTSRLESPTHVAVVKKWRPHSWRYWYSGRRCSDPDISILVTRCGSSSSYMRRSRGLTTSRRSTSVSRNLLEVSLVRCFTVCFVLTNIDIPFSRQSNECRGPSCPFALTIPSTGLTYHSLSCARRQSTPLSNPASPISLNGQPPTLSIRPLSTTTNPCTRRCVCGLSRIQRTFANSLQTVDLYHDTFFHNNTARG